MSQFCNDRDLLLIEPSLFTCGVFNGQRLGYGSSGTLSGSSFTVFSTDFLASGVKPGMVLCLYSGQISEGEGYEIVSVDSAYALTVSVPRATTDSPVIAPTTFSQTKDWQILTFAPQIAAMSAALSERLRTICEASGINQGDFADSAQLRGVTAYATLAGLFAAAADGTDDDARWSKSRYYESLYRDGLLRLRLALDADGDGLAEQTRTLANVHLRRV